MIACSLQSSRSCPHTPPPFTRARKHSSHTAPLAHSATHARTHGLRSTNTAHCCCLCVELGKYHRAEMERKMENDRILKRMQQRYDAFVLGVLIRERGKKHLNGRDKTYLCTEYACVRVYVDVSDCVPVNVHVCVHARCACDVS